MEFDSFHGLVIVHPEFPGFPRNPNYRSNLTKTIEVFNTDKKPIFVARDIISRPQADIWAELSRVRAWTLPIISPDDGIFPSVKDFLAQNQREVDFIVSKIALPRNQIRLIFGGLNAQECVYGFATAYCAVVETSYPGIAEPTVPNPIGYGKVFDEIV
jgi:hypothetical protein